MLAEGTDNRFTDGGKYTAYGTENAPKGCFYSRRDLNVTGDGRLTVHGNVKNGLVCGADLEIGGGASLWVEAKDNAVKGNNSVKITKKAGTVYAHSKEGDALKTDAIQVDDQDETLRYIEPEKGTVIINGGDITLSAPKGDGIQADRSCAVKGGKLKITAGKEAIKANESAIPEAADFDGIPEATVFVSGSVDISGGTLALSAGEDGVKAADSLLISGGSVEITSGCDCFQSDNTLTVPGGTITAKAGGGYKARLSDEDSSAKGLKAETLLNVTNGTITLDTADDALHSGSLLNVSGGKLTVSTGDDGLHADYRLTLGAAGGSDEDFDLRVLQSYEALEASVISVLSGTAVLSASDDGINAAGYYNEAGKLLTSEEPAFSDSDRLYTAGGFDPPPGGEKNAPFGMLYLKGGKVYVKAEGDGLDSNGSIAMTGGTVVVDAPKNSGNGTFDYEERSGSFRVSGGMLVGIGPRAMTVSVTVTGVTSYETGGRSGSSSTSGKAGTPVSFRVSGTTYTLTPTRNWSYVFLSAAGLDKSSFSTAATAGQTPVLGYTQGNTYYGLCK